MHLKEYGKCMQQLVLNRGVTQAKPNIILSFSWKIWRINHSVFKGKYL